MNSLSRINKHKILVTGASGYLGAGMCSKLLSMGATVLGVSRQKPPIDDPLFQFATADLTDFAATHKLITHFCPDVVFHLAGLAAGGRDQNLILPTFHSNLSTTVNILSSSSETNVRRIILAGSLEEPHGKDMDTAPSSPYAASKWAASAYGRMFYNLYRTPVVILRVFMTYGPGKQSPNKLIPWVIRSLINGKPPELTSGERRIDWIYIDDVLEGMIAAAMAPGIEGDTIDIGSGKLLSIRDIVDNLVQIINPDIRPQFGAIPERLLEQVRKADIEKTYKKIDWEPKTPLKKGLEITVEWFRVLNRNHHNLSL